MAQRRMFSKDITEHDGFLEMPLSTQALYFHLGMQADDDGFVSPNRIVRMIGCQADDIKLLIAKRFILPFEDGVVVIKHWQINNYIQKDRYKITKHVEKMALLKVKDNGAYTLDTKCIQNVHAGKVSIGKDTVEPGSKNLEINEKDMWNKTADDFEEELQIDPDHKPEKKTKKKVSDDVQAVFDLFSNPARVTWRLREVERVSAQALFDTYGLEKLKKRIDRIEKEKKNKDPLFPLITTPSQLLDKMPNVERYLNL